MASDRLVAALLFLQQQGSATAAEVATELEVSERTARRVLESLAVAGVPVYSRAGRGGGWTLVGGARTDLTGLTGPEVRALFFEIGAVAPDSPAMHAALRKLVQAVPATLRDDARAAAESVAVDVSGWSGVADATPPQQPPFLDVLRSAVVEQRSVVLDYAPPGRAASQRVVDPMGLVVKRGVWYLVALTAKGRRTFRVERVTEAVLAEDHFERPVDFDLDAAWREIVVEVADKWGSGCVVHGVASPEVLAPLRFSFHSMIEFTDAPDEPEGWMAFTARTQWVLEAAARFGGFGSSVRIDSPEEVRTELVRIGKELTEQYSGFSRRDHGN